MVTLVNIDPNRWPHDTPSHRLTTEAQKVQDNFEALANVQAIADQVQLFDDFHGVWSVAAAHIAERWGSTAGAGTGNAVATTVANSLGGEVTLQSASDDGTHAQNCSTFGGANLGWRADQGNMALEARLKISDVSEAVLFVGFSDALHTTVELPIYLLAGDIDSDADNAAGVGYDVDGSTLEFFHGGVKATADTAPVFAGVAPVDNVYFRVRVQIDNQGRVQGYINGTAIPGGRVNNAVTVTTPLSPLIVIGNRSANQVTATIDYVLVEQDR